MFLGCSSLSSLDVSGWDTSSLANIHSMFANCSSLSSVDLSGWDTSSVTDMGNVFTNCSSLASVDLSGWDVSSATDIDVMFNGCSSLTSLDLSGWDTSSVKRMGSMFFGCSSLTSLDLSGWDTSSVTNMESMFSGCSSLKTLDVSGWDTSLVTDMGSMFSDCSSLASLDVSGWDTSLVTDMGSMFSGCSSLKTLDVSGWDTSLVTYMGSMFSGCSSLVSLDLSGWDTSLVSDMNWMFEGCSSLASLDVSGWDTSSVTDMNCLFSGCSSLTSLDLSGWDTSSVTDMENLLQSCSKLASLDVADWNTSRVTDMGFMFSGCSSLASLDLSGWDTSSVTDMYFMFNSCRSLASVTVGDKYQIKSLWMFPDAISKKGWWSVTDEVWYAKDDICAKRSGIADTYLNQGSGASWERLAGNGRYDTMAAIVSEGWSGQTGGTVVVATGEGFKDALAAAGLAGLDNAPVVLTASKLLSAQARARLAALRPKKVYVAGGTFAVSDEVVSAIQKVTGVRPERVSGANGCSTSAALATAGKGRWGDTAIIATDKSFKDALSVAPVSYARHWPILLSGGGKSLNKDVVAALKACGVKRAYIVGGKLAVTEGVEKQLKDNGIELLGRLAGANGPATSRAIADFALESGLTVANMAFATSQNFPDALAGAALCGRNGSVLLLCDDRAQDNLSFANDHASGIETGYVFGGNLAFSEDLFDRLPE